MEEDQTNSMTADSTFESTSLDYSTEMADTTTTLTTTTRDPNFLYIVEPILNVTVDAGKEVRLRCHVKGYPPPKFRWFKNEAPFEPERRGRVTVRKGHDGSKIRIRNLDVADTGYYRCEASNGVDKVETTGILKVMMVQGRTPPPLDIEDEDPSADYADLPHFPDEDATEELSAAEMAELTVRAPDLDAPGTCQLYKGSACAKFLKNATVFIGNAYTQTQIEENLMAAFASIPKHTDELSAQCTEYAVPSLCYHMFPACDEGSLKNRPRQLCKDECSLLESEICRKEYAIANDHPVLKQFMPDCSKLPAEESPENRKCVRLGLRPSKHSSKVTREECFDDRGQTYAGTAHHTLSGAECLKWNGVQHPDFAHHNFCRNPDGAQQKPWCFNAKTSTPELCNIPQCPRPFQDALGSYLTILIPCGVVLFLAALISLIICLCRRNRKKHRKDSFKANIKTNPLELNALIPKYQIHLKIPEVMMSSLRLHNILGEGQMGKVFSGEVLTDGYSRPVVIRMLKDAATAKMKMDFQRELTHWTEFRHSNVVALIGAHTDRDPLAMIFEHASCGDLHEYLETMAEKGAALFQSKEYGPVVDHLNMATQVAAGLDFLASHNYVHRDVATRNCWVFENGVIKVADHGVGPSRYPMDYSQVQGHVLPIRWMAPESINYGQFSIPSAVWSFGVLMWEIWTEGTQPYYGFAHDEIVEMIRLRQLLPQPDDCPPSIHSLMVECWHENPVRRPEFKEIHQRLWNWEHGRMGSSSSSGAEHSNPGRSRSTVSQQSSTGPGSHSNNTGSTHISNGMALFNLPALPNSPMCNSKFSNNNTPRRLLGQAGTQTGSMLIIPPSPQLRNSALNTPLLRGGPRFIQSLPQNNVLNNNLNFDSFRTTNL